MSEWTDQLVADAISDGRPEVIAAAIATVADPNYRFSSGETPLTLATDVAYGPEGTFLRVHTLLALGARVSAEDSADGATISVHRAARDGHLDTLSALLAADGKVALGRFDDLGRTPLICAVDGGHERAARLLLEAGSPVNAHDEARIGNTALSQAVQWSHLRIVELLLRHGADPTIPGWMQLSALDLAEDAPPEFRAAFHALLAEIQPRP